MKDTISKDSTAATASHLDTVWNTLKNKDMSLFSLPNTKVSEYFDRLPDFGGFLTLKQKNPGMAVLPFFESVLKAEKLELEIHTNYLVIKTHSSE